MRALILQFEADDPPEFLGRRLTARTLDWDVVRVDESHAPLTLDGYDLLIALGGYMCANDTAAYPFLREAMDLIREAVARDVACLGICLGGQLMARALGGTVTRSREKEVGRVSVALTPRAQGDPLLRGLGPTLETTQYHEDVFSVPPGGVLLASSAHCAQIVRCAPRAYALQFHPEISWQTFAAWVEQGYDHFVGSARAGDGCALAEDVRAHAARIEADANRLFDNVVRLSGVAPPRRLSGAYPGKMPTEEVYID